MPLPNFLTELWAYAQTKEYREGLFVEASGLVLDVILLIVGVKIIAYYLARQSRSTTSFASSFFIIQFLRDVVLLQLKSGGVADIDKCLNAALRDRKLDSLFSHFLYGNTENLFDLLRIRMKSGEHIAGHVALTSDERDDIGKEARALLARLDSLLVILASLRQEEHCVRAYEFRLALTAASDYLEDLSMSSEAPPPHTYAPMSTAIASAAETWFLPCKRVLDRQYQSRIRRSYARFLFSLPWTVSYRFIVRRWKRIRGLPYTDPFGSNFPQLFAYSLAHALGDRWSEAIASAAIDTGKLRLVTTQHRAVPQDTCIRLFEEIRPFVDPTLWNTSLAAALIADLDSSPISIVTVDAAKANALYYLTKLSSKDESGSEVVARTFRTLWKLHPSSM